MAATYRSGAGATQASSTTLTINKPTNTAEGDVLMAVINKSADVSVSAGPSGWTKLTEINRTCVWYKVAGASEPANYTWTFPSSITSSGGIIAVYGATTNSGNFAGGSGQFAGPSATITALDFTCTADNALLVFLAGSRGTGTYTPPSGLTEAVDTSSSVASEIAYKSINAGAVGNQSATGPNDYYSAYMYAIPSTIVLKKVAGVTYATLKKISGVTNATSKKIAGVASA